MIINRRLLAIWQVSVCEIRLRLLGFQRVAGRLLEDPPAHLQRQWQHTHSPLRTLESSTRLPWSTCLTRAVAAASQLRRRGYPARLRLGTADNIGFSAHAWIEIGSRQWSAHGHSAMEPVPGRNREVL